MISTTTESEKFTQNESDIEYNKTLVYNYKLNNIPYFIDIFFNKNNTLLNISYTCEMSDLKFRIIRNLNNSAFVNNFIKLKNLNKYMNDSIFYDVKNGFLYDYNDKKAKLLFTDSLNMNSGSSNKRNLNYLNVRGYGLTEYKNKYLFLFIERSKYIAKQNCIKTRTAAIEIFKSDLNPDNII